jgi:hypothetical protein
LTHQTRLGNLAPMLTALDYLYRDAANYKAHATALFTGELSPAEVAEIVAKLDSRTYFVPEQLGLPPLQSRLHALSDGPTSADHAFHELLGFRHATAEEAQCVTPVCTTQALLARIRTLTFWNPRPSNWSPA